MAEEDIQKLKKRYEEFRKKYNLPDFSEVNSNFGIEELAEHQDTEYFGRRLRVCIVERVIGLLRILESVMNPSNSPIFIHVISKNLDPESKSVFEELYKAGCDIEIKSMVESLILYDEKREFEMISHIILKWNEMKPKVKQLNDFILDAWKKDSMSSGKDYLG